LVRILIEEYENRAHSLPKAVLPKSRVPEILSGKRSISKAQARHLAEILRVPVGLFV
jgi:antitoxin component HigA of HigAB toxin-antitoxin module